MLYFTVWIYICFSSGDNRGRFGVGGTEIDKIAETFIPIKGCGELYRCNNFFHASL